MIASGRFDHEHYISMWTKRLVDMGVAIMDAAEANTPEAISQRRVEAAAVAAADTLSCHTERTDVAPAVKPDMSVSTDRIIIFGADEPADARLDKLFSKAMELEHPGIDEEGIATMKSKIADGQFKVEHYIDMWTRRLETDMDVVVQVEHAVIDGEPKSETTAAAPANEAKATPTVDSSDGTRGPEETTFTQSSVMVVYDKDEPPASKLDKLFAMAMDLQHPGIDQEGIYTMKGEHLAANLAKLETKMWKVQEAGRGEGGAGSVLSRGDFSRHGGTADCR
eukprot:SAG31_NODE_2635_length_5340_cov_15.869681_6_plen_280_part_00